MEDILEVYQRPYMSEYPVICLDETNRQLIEETRPSLALKPGESKKVDFEYHRNGVIDFFMMFAFDIKQVIQIYTNHPYTYHKLDSCTGSDRTAEDERQWENIYYYFGQRYENNFYINLSD